MRKVNSDDNLLLPNTFFAALINTLTLTIPALRKHIYSSPLSEQYGRYVSASTLLYAHIPC